MLTKRRQYKKDIVKAAMIYFVYLDKGEEAAFKLADKYFGKIKSNVPLKKKLELYKKGGWKKDWLTNMYRDIDKIINKYKN